MGLLFVLFIVGFILCAVALGVHALRAEPSMEKHHWLAVVPLLIFWLFILTQLITSP